MELSEAIQMIRRGLAMLEDASTPPGKRGRRFEEDFVQMCRDRGISASRTSGRGNVDIIANNLRVQAKCYPYAKSGRFRLKNGHMAPYSVGDFDVLAASVFGELFIVPASSLAASRNTSTMASTVFVHDIQRYKDAWHVMVGKDADGIVSQKEISFR
jgi:hypothetical protein